MTTFCSVLFVLNRFPGIGGIENVTISLANYLARIGGIRCSIMSVYGQEGVVLNDSLDNNVHFYCLDGNIELANRKIAEIQMNEGISHVIYQDSYSPTLYLLDYFDRNKVTIIVVEHNTPNALIRDKVAEFVFEPVSSKRQLIRKILFPYIYIKNILQVVNHHRKAYAATDKYVLLSKTYMAMVARMVGKTDKLIYINNPITISSNGNKTNHAINKKRDEILFICRLTPQKGTDLVLKVWKKFSNLHSEWTLRIVGDGPERVSMEQYVKKYKLHNVIFEGYKTNVISFYERAKLVCVTSRFEGWGLVLVEGMIYSCVPIAFDSYSAVNDIIDNGINGFIVKAYRIQDYVQRLCEIADNQHMLEKMQVEARRKATLFSMDHIGHKWVELLKTGKVLNE